MTMSEYLDANDSEMVRAMIKRCTPPPITRTSGSGCFGLSQLYRHTYWDREEQTNYNIMFSHYFNMGHS